MRAQHCGALLLCAQISHHTIPERTCSTQFRYLHEEIHADSEEERKTTGELVYIKSRSHSVAHIFGTIRNGEGQFLHLCRTGFLHMIARDGDAVELRHVLRGIAENVRNDPHRRFWRINVGVADHELLLNVVLDRKSVVKGKSVSVRVDMGGGRK